MKQLKLVAESFIGARAGEFRGLKFSGGEIDVREANGRARGVPGDGGEEIVFAGVEDGDIGGRARRDHANHFAADEFFARAGLLHLVADGNFEPGANQARDVAFGGMIRNAAHGNGLALFAIARSERDLQLARGSDGVLVEKLVEIAEAEE